MLHFEYLTKIPLEEIVETFNSAFADYIIPLSLTKETLEEKILNDSIKLEYSLGAFHNSTLVAFVLHGFDCVNGCNTLYNAGTGVIPSFRGQGIPAQLYDFAQPFFYSLQIDKILLEVIDSNQTAIKCYKKIGFEKVRELNGYKGSLKSKNLTSALVLHELKGIDPIKFKSLWDFEPSWQYSITAINSIKSSIYSLAAFENEQLIGYVLYKPSSKRILQLSVDKKFRNRGIASQFLEALSKKFGKEMSVINVDASNIETHNFLQSSGFQPFIKQYEMELLLKRV